MPSSYLDLLFCKLIGHQRAYDIINKHGDIFYDNWDINRFEGACIQNETYGPPAQWRAFRDYISLDLLELDREMPLLKLDELGQHFGYELFLQSPPVWGSRGAPGFWNKVSRAFSEDKLPCSKEYFIEKYMEIVNQYNIPFGQDEYVNIPEFDHGGISAGNLGGLFAKEGLEILLERLEKYQL